MSRKKPTLETELQTLQRESFCYFLNETNPANGLVRDKTAPDSPASIAATGFALAAYPVGIERGFMSRMAAVERTLATLRFFWNSPHGPEPDAIRVFIITFSIRRRAVAPGNASCQRWTAPSCWPAC